MTKKEMIAQINEHAKSFVGCDGVYGIKGYSSERLAAMLAAYQKMADANQKARDLLTANGCSEYDTIRYSLMGDNAPSWYHEYWGYKMQALEIWRTNF